MSQRQAIWRSGVSSRVRMPHHGRNSALAIVLVLLIAQCGCRVMFQPSYSTTVPHVPASQIASWAVAQQDAERIYAAEQALLDKMIEGSGSEALAAQRGFIRVYDLIGIRIANQSENTSPLSYTRVKYLTFMILKNAAHDNPNNELIWNTLRAIQLDRIEMPERGPDRARPK